MTSGSIYVIEFIESMGIEAGQKGILVAILCLRLVRSDNDLVQFAYKVTKSLQDFFAKLFLD